MSEEEYGRDVELIRGGADKTVTLDNLGEYIEAVVDSTVGSGVYAQVMALRAGFEVRPATTPHHERFQEIRLVKRFG